MNKTEYKKYLKSTEWREKTKLVRDRDNSRCSLCNSKSNLHVHHKTYSNVGNEPLDDLITLCSDCHGLFHHKIEPPKIYQDKQTKTKTKKNYNTKKKWNTNKWLKARKYAEDAGLDRKCILSNNRFKDSIKLDKKIIKLCLTFGYGLHSEAKYILFTKQNRKMKSRWQNKLVNTQLPKNDLESLFKYTQERELQQIKENKK